MSTRRLTSLAVLAACLAAAPASAETLVASEVVHGTNLNTRFQLTYNKPRATAPESIEVNVYLFTATGTLVKHRSGQALCGPCTVSIPSKRKSTIDVRSKMLANGGTLANLDGYAIITSNGEQATMDALVQLVDMRTGSPKASYAPKVISAPAP